MERSSYQRTSLYRLLFTFVACLGLLLGGFNVYKIRLSPSDECTWVDSPQGVRIISVQKGGTTDRAGMLPRDILLQIAGENATNGARAQAILNRQQVDQVVPYLLFRDGQLVVLDVQIVQRGYPLFYLTMCVVGFIFWVIGVWIIWMRPRDPKARILFLLFLSFVLFWTLNITSPFSKGLLLVFLTLQNVSFTTIPVFFLYFFLLFPWRHPYLDKKPWIHLLLFSPTILILGWFILVFFFRCPSPVNALVGTFLWGSYFALGMIRLHKCYKTAQDVQLRQQIRVLHWGLSLGLIPSFLLVLLAFLSIRLPLSNYGVLFMGLIPLVFAYTVVRHRLMDIEFIVKKSFVYALLTGLVVGFYLLIVQVLGRFLQDISGLTGTFVLVLTTLFVAVVFAPVRGRIQRVVDRAFYRESYDYRETLRKFARTLNTLMEPDTLMETVLVKICETMHIRQGYFFVESKKLHHYAVVKEYPSLGTKRMIPVKIDGLLCKKMIEERGPVLFSELDRNDRETKELTETTEGIAAVPLFHQNKLLGFFLLGLKQSEAPYSAGDLELLATLADQTAVALENGRLHHALTEQERMKRELEIARQIQLNSLPQSIPSLPGFDIYGCSLPATEVGGDYYDYLVMPNGRLGIVVGDVSGKGTSAALYQSKIQGFFRALIVSIHRPKDLLSRVNRLAFENVEEKSVTAARAGHTATLYFSKQKNRCDWWAPPGIGLALDGGKVFDQKLREEKKYLKKGDVLLFYSDGLTEATNKEGEEFGEDRLKDAFCRNVDFNAKSLVQNIVKEIEYFVEEYPQKDDVTLVVLKVSNGIS